MEHARSSVRFENDIGLSLDMEKAYERIHPTYLNQGLTRREFPESTRPCIHNLFFGTNMCI